MPCRPFRRPALAAALVILATTAAQGRQLPAPADRAIDFAADVQPILEASCVRCHGRGKARGGFSLETRDALLRGGDNGDAVVPGDSAASELIALVAALDPGNVMPEKGSRLTAAQVGILRAWIDQGLPWTPGVTFARAEPKNLEPRAPDLPPGDGHPIDRLLAPYFARHGIVPGPPAADRVVIRRLSLDLVGLLPSPDAVRAFEQDRGPDRHARLVARLLSDDVAYAEHWLTFWNDLLRNDYRGTGYIDGGRRQITRWLYDALLANRPYDRFVTELVNPAADAEGFTRGIIWRGVVNASQTPEMQAAQNISQVFMGVNLKCASCHDSFINDWQLADAYGMAGIYADAPLEMVECDRPTGRTAAVRFLYPRLGEIDAAAGRSARMAQLAEVLTGPDNGRLSRTFVNRLWARFLGRGLVEPVDDMEQAAWHPDLLDWLAEDFVASGYDVKHAIARIVTSRAYLQAAVDVPDRVEEYVFRGPAIRRLTAEQFADALSAVTGVWQPAPAGDFDFTSADGDAAPTLAATWIAPADASAATGSAYFRATVEVPQIPVAAYLLMTSARPYTVYVNGEAVLEQRRAAPPRVVDVLSRLRQGSNALAIALAAPAADAAAAPPPSLLAQVLVRRDWHEETPATIAASGRDWQATTIAPHEGWERAASSGGPWSSAVEAAAPEGQEAVARALAAAGRRHRARASLVPADPLTTALGRPAREQVVTARSSPATTLQALELLNGETLAGALQRGADRLLADGPAEPSALIDLVYERALGRKPTAGESAICLELMRGTRDRAGVEDLLWAVAMLPEFQLVR